MLRVRRPTLRYVRRSDATLPGRVSLQLGQFPGTLPRPTLFPGVSKKRASSWQQARVLPALRRRRSVRTYHKVGLRQAGLRKWSFLLSHSVN